jgi:ADP-heptose:LPS heptosyltransferase
MVTARVLVVRLDNAGDVLLAGPAVRAVARSATSVTVLAGPHGTAAARLLPAVDEVLTWRCPWIDPRPEPVDPAELAALVLTIRAGGFDRGLILTSYHQSPLPTALLLRQAGVGWLGAISDDYPGSLLDLRHRLPDDLPEAERALSLARAAGFELPDGDDGRLRVRDALPDVSALVPAEPYVVVHPGTSVPARAWPASRHAEAVAALTARGWPVLVTGAPSETGLTAEVAAAGGADLGGRTDLAELAAVLRSARVVVAGNTGPAHLAASVATPVVSLFAPTVPAVRWAPYGVPTVLLGDQQAPCRDTRVTTCSVPGHPCLTSVTAGDVVAAVEQLAGPTPVRTRADDELEVAR